MYQERPAFPTNASRREEFSFCDSARDPGNNHGELADATLLLDQLIARSRGATRRPACCGAFDTRLEGMGIPAQAGGVPGEAPWPQAIDQVAGTVARIHWIVDPIRYDGTRQSRGQTLSRRDRNIR